MTTLGSLTIIERDTLSDGRSVYVARDGRYRSCMAHGETADEAADNLEEARELYFEDMPETNVPASVSGWRVAPSNARRDTPLGETLISA